MKGNTYFRSLIIPAAALILAACATRPSLLEQLEQLPVKHLSFYNFDPSTPIKDRITDVPAELLGLYSDSDDTELRSYKLTADEKKQIEDTFSRLPDRHREVLEKRLIGVYCVENFIGTGMADYVLGPDNEVYAQLVLHPRVFEMNASQILSLRANTAFRSDDEEMELVIDLSNEVSGLDYIVLHESTHIVDYVERHTPYVEPGMYELFGRSGRNTSFTDEVWSDYRTLNPTVEFEFQEDLRYYGLGGDPGLSNRDLKAVYSALAQTPFASLYASFSWAEDFAEFVTFYYLVYGFGAHYEIRVMRDGESLFTYQPMDSLIVAVRAGLIEPDLLRSELPQKNIE
ncbi:MAG: hypothetical protein HN368_23485 [Spirochaetales bacterium]|jgi:hypothetical protein|nr:hypothetical protein [Spirochaetales bacterium]